MLCCAAQSRCVCAPSSRPACAVLHAAQDCYSLLSRSFKPLPPRWAAPQALVKAASARMPRSGVPSPPLGASPLGSPSATARFAASRFLDVAATVRGGGGSRPPSRTATASRRSSGLPPPPPPGVLAVDQQGSGLDADLASRNASTVRFDTLPSAAQRMPSGTARLPSASSNGAGRGAAGAAAQGVLTAGEGSGSGLPRMASASGEGSGRSGGSGPGAASKGVLEVEPARQATLRRSATAGQALDRERYRWGRRAAARGSRRCGARRLGTHHIPGVGVLCWCCCCVRLPPLLPCHTLPPPCPSRGGVRSAGS